MKPSVEDILDRCLEAARAGGDPEAVLREHPEHAAEVRSLLPLADRLGALPGPEPSREVMMTALARALVGASSSAPAAPAPRRRRRWLRPAGIAAAVAFGVVLAGWATLGAAAGSVPGDLLYPVKLLGEQVRYALAVGPDGKAELLLVFSDARLREAIRRHEQGKGIDRQLLVRMLRHAQRALEAGPELPESDRTALVARVTWVCLSQKQTLEELKMRATPEEQQALEPFVAACDERCECLCRMNGRCENCAPPRLTAEAMRAWLERFSARPPEDGSRSK